MTVGELKAFIARLDDGMIVVTSKYNSGYGGLFDADAEVVKTKDDDVGYEEHCKDGDFDVLKIG